MATEIRRKRISREIQRILMDELSKTVFGVSSPDHKFLPCISYVEMSKDLRNARVFVSGSDTLIKALNKDQGHYRNIVAQLVTMKYAPAIQFKKDTVEEGAMKFERLLSKIKNEDKAAEFNILRDEVVEKLLSAENILIVSHINSDGDNIGSTIGLARSLNQSGKKAIVANKTGVPDNFLFLKGTEAVVSTEDLLPEYDTIVFADCGSIERPGLSNNIIEAAAVTINFDHHTTNTRFADYNLIDRNAPSTGSVIYDMLKDKNLPIDIDTATALYTALLTDTGSFRYSSTSSSAFNMASDLLSIGVKPWYVASNIYESKKPSQIKLLGRLLDGMEFFFDNRVALITVTEKEFDETKTTAADTEGAVNYARGVKGVEIGVLIRIDHDNSYKVSLRSKNFDITPVALEFGGGGHKNASGFHIEGPLEKAKSMLIAAIRKLFYEK